MGVGYERSPEGPMSRDWGVMEAVREIVPEWTLELFSLLALLGDLLLIVPVLGLLYLSDVGSTLRRARKTGGSDTGEPLCTDRTVFLIGTVFGGLALVAFLKPLFGLPRPPVEFHAIEPSEYGFPSGHALAATVFWGTFALWGRVGSFRIRLSGALIAITLVGLSRLALGVHFLSDVLASVGFGALYLLVIALVTDERPERAFLVAIVVAIAALAVAPSESRSILAFAGSVGAVLGWKIVESPPIKDLLLQFVTRF